MFRLCEGQILSRIIAHDFSVTNLQIQCICIRKHRWNLRNSCRGETFEGWTVEIEAISNVFSSWHVQNRGNKLAEFRSMTRVNSSGSLVCILTIFLVYRECFRKKKKKSIFDFKIHPYRRRFIRPIAGEKFFIGRIDS